MSKNIFFNASRRKKTTFENTFKTGQSKISHIFTSLSCNWTILCNSSMSRFVLTSSYLCCIFSLIGRSYFQGLHLIRFEEDQCICLAKFSSVSIYGASMYQHCIIDIYITSISKNNLCGKLTTACKFQHLTYKVRSYIMSR